MPFDTRLVVLVRRGRPRALVRAGRAIEVAGAEREDRLGGLPDGQGTSLDSQLQISGRSSLLYPVSGGGGGHEGMPGMEGTQPKPARGNPNR
jgi:hypothetical protein